MQEKQNSRNAKWSDQEWISLIQECRSSGLGDKDWCEQHSIPISSFYTKITRLSRKACDVPKAQYHMIRETQQVVPLQIIEERTGLYDTQNPSGSQAQVPAVILKIHGYSVEIANHAVGETILNTLSALQQLCCIFRHMKAICTEI